MKEKSFLGIFDSGVGGFSVFKEIRKNTDVDIIYFGDCARAPYGNRNEVEIISFIKETLIYLKRKKVTHFVSACNSMSVFTTEKLLEEVGIPKENYIDMVSAVTMISFKEKDKVLIIGTKATILSGVYQVILEEKNISFEVFYPLLLAGGIEEGNNSIVAMNIKEIIKYAIKVKATHILYACTHYPLVDSLFKKEATTLLWLGEFVNPAYYVALGIQVWNLKGNSSSFFETSLETEVFKGFVKNYIK